MRDKWLDNTKERVTDDGDNWNGSLKEISNFEIVKHHSQFLSFQQSH